MTARRPIQLQPMCTYGEPKAAARSCAAPNAVYKSLTPHAKRTRRLVIILGNFTLLLNVAAAAPRSRGHNEAGPGRFAQRRRRYLVARAGELARHRRPRDELFLRHVEGNHVSRRAPAISALQWLLQKKHEGRLCPKPSRSCEHQKYVRSRHSALSAFFSIVIEITVFLLLRKRIDR